jgi:hypothetical protein
VEIVGENGIQSKHFKIHQLKRSFIKFCTQMQKKRKHIEIDDTSPQIKIENTEKLNRFFKTIEAIRFHRKERDAPVDTMVYTNVIDSLGSRNHH